MLLNGLWEEGLDINQVFELRGKTSAFFGVGALEKFDFILKELKKEGISNILLVTDDVVYTKTGIKAKIEKMMGDNDVKYTVYNGIKPNPNTEMVDEIKKIGVHEGVTAVVGIGGGSHIDAAKSAAILIHHKNRKYNCSDLYEFRFTPEEAIPVIAVNTTHGTGTEVDRFAVVTIEEKEYKPAIAYDIIYPRYSINDPEVTKTLPWGQTTYTAIDAINHVTEAATTTVATPYSILLAKETIRLVEKYLPGAQENPDDLKSRYYLMYASSIAGICFDNGMLHFTHALEHPLSGVNPTLTHGLGLAILLPAVVKAVYPAKANVLAEIFEPIVPGLKGTADEALQCAQGIEKWLYRIGVDKKLVDEGFSEKDVDKLVRLSFETPSLEGLIKLAPVEGSRETVRQIYMDSLYPLNKSY